MSDPAIGLTDIDLSRSMRMGRYGLPEPTRTAAPSGNLLAQEASAVTYNREDDCLYVLGDGGTAMVRVSKTGRLLDFMTLAAGNSPQDKIFYDPEGLASIGGGRLVLVEERERQVVQFSYVAGSTLTRDQTKQTSWVQRLGTSS
jgi:hypothetical protein